jgi:SAM-dependent methyltransferase
VTGQREVQAPEGFLHYGRDFYDSHVSRSLAGARHYANIVSSIFRPRSVVDIGCGRGAWLAAFQETGAAKLVGLDGAWLSQNDMLNRFIEFREVNLETFHDTTQLGRFDLAISVEVAEHLQPSRSDGFCRLLTSFADSVVFGSAFNHQPGTNHINLRLCSFWGLLFASKGYAAFDLFRPPLWGNDDVAFYYQQNTFFYTRREGEVFNRLLMAGITPIENLNFMDCVHPSLLNTYAERPLLSKKAMKNFAKANIPERFQGLLKWAKRGFFKKGQKSK